MGKELTEHRTQDREMTCWRLRCQGLTQFEVAERMGISQPAVSKILTRVSRRFEAEFVEEQRQYRMQQTSILEAVASEALRAWEKSKLDAETEVTTKGKSTEGEKSDRSRVQIVTTRQGQSGNPAHLHAAMKAMADVRAIWGMEQPHRLEHSGPEGGPVEYRAAGYALDGKITGIVAALAAGEAAGDPEPRREG